jgi:hypothetical protein
LGTSLGEIGRAKQHESRQIQGTGSLPEERIGRRWVCFRARRPPPDQMGLSSGGGGEGNIGRQRRRLGFRGGIRGFGGGNFGEAATRGLVLLDALHPTVRAAPARARHGQRDDRTVDFVACFLFSAKKRVSVFPAFLEDSTVVLRTAALCFDPLFYNTKIQVHIFFLKLFF